MTLLRKLMTSMVIAALPASIATAATQSYSFVVPQTMGAFTNSFTLPNFNPAQGTLTGATITFSSSTTASVEVINSSMMSQPFTNATSSVPLTLMGPGGLSATINATAGPFSGTAAPSSNTFVPAATTLGTLTIIVPSADLSLFETPAGSTGPYTFSAGVGTYSGSSTPMVVFFGGSATAGGTATITFTYIASGLVKYTANLNIGESYIDITNTGANGAALQGPGFGAQFGNICVNVYAFDPSEELISCCSCLVTPDQTVDLGVTRDLTSKTLTGVVPASVTVKLVPTLAGGDGTGSSCTNSAATVTTTALAIGVAAWGTTLHPTSTGSYATTETPFTPSTLSDGELASIGGRCTAILGNGSSFGVCSSCRSGALGGSKLP